jgi:FdhD protein
MIRDSDRKALAQPIDPGSPCLKYVGGKWQPIRLSVPRETAFSIYINNRELVTILCTPSKLNCLAWGYLLGEGIIGDRNYVVSMRVCEDDGLADLKLRRSDFVLPQKKFSLPDAAAVSV